MKGLTKKMKKYTIKSTSNEGVYYLVNGWRKTNTFWFNEKSVMENPEFAKLYFFSKPQYAKTSLTKLLKIMPDYETDNFEIVEF